MNGKHPLGIINHPTAAGGAQSGERQAIALMPKGKGNGKPPNGNPPGDNPPGGNPEDENGGGENWRSETFKLSPRHRWKARKGNSVFVADRGALSFEVPRTWIRKMGPAGSIQFYNAKPPKDDLRLEVTLFYLSAFSRTVDWNGLSLPGLLRDATRSESEAARGGVSSLGALGQEQLNLGQMGQGMRRMQWTKTGPVITYRAGNLEVAWRENEFIDETEKRPAHSRIGTVRDAEAKLQALITLDYWPEDAHRAAPVWDDVLGTIKMGQYIENPLMGPDP